MQNINLAREFIAALHKGRHPDAVAAMFSDTLFEIPSDDGVLPGVGIKRQPCERLVNKPSGAGSPPRRHS